MTEGDGSSAGQGPRATLARGNPSGGSERERGELLEIARGAARAASDLLREARP